MSTKAPSEDAALPLCILIVEDEPIIAIDLQFLFSSQGFDVLGPANSVDMALNLLNSSLPNVAVLDVNLHGHSVVPVARRLQSLGIPFVLSSAYDAADLQCYDVLANIENVQKPVQAGRMLTAIRRALTSAGRTPHASVPREHEQ